MNIKLEALTTEQINPRTTDIDEKNTEEILTLINKEDATVAEAVAKEIPSIGQAVDGITARMKQGGRLFYVGAGTSGRLGILDASECPPTYGTNPELVQAIIAGGESAVFKAVEGAEDSEELGRQAIHEAGVKEQDTVVGIAASGRTPFVLGAIQEAKAIGALTVGLSNNSASLLKQISDIAITPEAGPEVVMGSTRMKAGTSQKLVLNMISTSVMIKLGKVYGNLMVDLNPANEKLISRAARIISLATGLGHEEAHSYLMQADKNPKTAIVMAKTGYSKDQAKALLQQAEGFVSKALEIYKEGV